MNRRACCAFLCTLAFATVAHAHLTPADGAQRAGFEQRLSAQLPAALAFRDEADRDVRLGDYFGATPIVLVFAWYGCTTLCPTVVGNVAEALRRSGGAPGTYQVLVASIDPRDAPADARRMKRRYLARANVDADAWHLLTGSAADIAALTHAAGFRYAYDDDTHQYAHPAGIVLLTPQGTIARYFFGFDFTPAALHDAVDAAAADVIGSPVERLLLVCFHFAPAGPYSALVLQALRIGSIALLVAGLALFVAIRRRTALR